MIKNDYIENGVPYTEYHYDINSINSYFNEDNSAGIGNCVRLKDGRYVMFASERDCSLAFRVEMGEKAQAAMITEPRRSTSTASATPRIKSSSWGRYATIGLTYLHTLVYYMWGMIASVRV